MTGRMKRSPCLHRMFTGVATAKVAEVSHSQGLVEAVAKCMVVLSAGRSEGLEIFILCTRGNEKQRILLGMAVQDMYHETGKPVQPAILRVRYSALPRGITELSQA